jgi:CubicO group peptidase (beta-lactamase class C family)
MITAMYVVGKLAQQLGYVRPSELLHACAASLHPNNPAITQCYYEAYVRKYVVSPLNLQSTGFLPPKRVWKDIAPTWNDTSYRHLVIQGTVSDGNAYALGGISGHAGLFSTILDTARIAHKLMYCSPNDPYVNRTTVDFFTRAYNLTQSSRALGWDTNNYLMDSYRGCGNLSSNAYYHTGYTGTEVCCDPSRKIFTILLTNRCYPDSTSTLPAIQIVRQQFNNAVKSVIDSYSMESLEKDVLPLER